MADDVSAVQEVEQELELRSDRGELNSARQFRLGMRKSLPLVLGLVPFGLAYGVLAVQAGLTVAETALMSVVVFAGAAQFMSVSMIGAGAAMPLIVASTLLINLRHLLMGLSLSPYFSNEKPRWHRLLAYGLVDESYVASVTHYRESGMERGNPWFMVGSASVLWLAWQTTSIAGALAGQAIADPLRWGLDFAMPATFLTMLLPQVTSRRLGAVVLVAAVSATAAYVLIPGKWYILIAAVVATSTGVLLETLAEKRAES